MSAPITLLLIDDDEDDFVITRDLIEDIPGGAYRLVWTRSFEEGLAAWRRGDFDLILLDYRLGARTGLEFLRDLNEHGATTPVIILTGQGDREIDTAAMAAGAADYLIKSELSPSLLDRALRYALSMTAMHQRLLDEQKRLMQVDKLSTVGLLAAGVAHEVNNPLAGVKSLVASLREGTLSPERRKEYFDAIDDGLARMGATIRGLLDYAREQPLTFAKIELNDVAAACLRLLAATLRGKGLSAENRIAAGARVRGDRSRLIQAVLNLVMNASDATPRGGAITLEAALRDNRVGIVVRDTGVGIAKEIAERVREPFFTTKPAGKGTGLGLAIVSNIATEHGGSLSIESEPGQGTAMTVWLRRA